MKNTSLEAITEEKDLGVTIDLDLKFHMHVFEAVNKAARMLRLVRATFTCTNETTLLRLFTTTVRSHLEYGNVIWCPRFRRDKLEVENIQRRATKSIPNLRSPPSLCYRTWPKLHWNEWGKWFIPEIEKCRKWVENGTVLFFTQQYSWAQDRIEFLNTFKSRLDKHWISERSNLPINLMIH